ncbi:fungal-specific transcription factor domain-containing protein [Xylariales sp. PMI_506]|nr:fungal-specific transcription factor domain-containing protein [Xylariales sp. PMI_506]
MQEFQPAAAGATRGYTGRTACNVCHRRKVKCDAHNVGFPCSNCQNTSRQHECQLHQKRKRVSKLKHSSAAAPGVSSTAHGVASRVPTQVPASRSSPVATAYAGSSQTPANAAESEPGGLGVSVEVHGHHRAFHRPGESPPHPRAYPEDEAIESREQTQSSSQAYGYSNPPPVTSSRTWPLGSLVGVTLDNSHEDDGGVFKRYLVEFIDQPQITQRPIDKDARIAYVGSECSNINFLLHQQFGPRTLGVSHYPTNRIPRRHTCHEPERLPVEAFQLPPKAVIDDLLDAYFTHINPVLPIVDKDLFMAQYSARDPLNPPSLLLLRAILVAGAHVRGAAAGHGSAAERESCKADFFRRAKMLFDARFEPNRDTVVQAAILLAWHTDGAEDILANAWFWIGIAIRTAIGLGMHRDADASTLVQHNKRMWRRVWWILVQCDVILAMQYGRPPTIDLDESDVKPPEALDSQDCGPEVQPALFLHSTELTVILAKGTRALFSFAAKKYGPRQTVLREVDEALAKWVIQLPWPMSHPLPEGADAPHHGVSLLQIQYHAALILFHRQQAYVQHYYSKSSISREDTIICSTAAAAIQQTFEGLCRRDEVRFLWLPSVNYLFTALIQLSVEARISNPILAIPALKRYESALVSLKHLTEYWPNAWSILHFFESAVQSENNTPLAVSVTPGDVAVVSPSPLMTLANSSLETRQEQLRGHGRGEHAAPAGSGSANVMGPSASTDIRQSTTQENGGNNQADLDIYFQNLPITPSSPEAARQLHSFWQEWQRLYGQEPELRNDFLFTF